MNYYVCLYIIIVIVCKYILREPTINYRYRLLLSLMLTDEVSLIITSS